MRVHVYVGFDEKVIGLLSPYSITVVYMPGTSIGFSVSPVSSSYLRTKEQGVVGEQALWVYDFASW